MTTQEDTTMNTCPKRYRYILRFECGDALRSHVERALVGLAQRLPGCQVSRNEYDDHGDHLMKTGRTELVARNGRTADPLADSDDPRGPFRTVDSVDQTPSANVATFTECGHQATLNATMAPPKRGDRVRCFQCGPKGTRARA